MIAALALQPALRRIARTPRIDRLAVLDNIPTRVIFERINAEIARGRWFFILNVPDLPEA
jgi:hypothetical protein